MLELARRHPEDPTSFDALAWLAIHGYNTTESEAAAEVLARRYGPEKRLWLICQEMRRGIISPARGILLRAVLEHNPDRATRGRACLDLAEYHVELANFVQILKTPGLMPWQAQAYAEERLDRFRALEPTQLAEEAGQMYQRVLDEFADVVPIKWWTVPRMIDSDPRTVYGPNQDGEPDTGTLADRGAARAGRTAASGPGTGRPRDRGPGHRRASLKAQRIPRPGRRPDFLGHLVRPLQGDVPAPARDRRAVEGAALRAAERHDR